jgi:1-acyl-sn-glycerol-3-phosphate acyltransferase
MAKSNTPSRQKRRDIRRQRRRIKASKSFNWFLRGVLRRVFEWLFRLEAENSELFRTLKPPFVVMPNHQSAIDPFFVNVFVPAPIHYVVSDSNFRSRLLSFGLGLVGSIPKTKAVSDLETVKNIVKIKAKRGVIGVYPEGQNTWDGATLPLIPATAKMLKSLKVPVVVAKVQGAFLSMPRWARRLRRGRVRITYFLGFSVDDLKRLSTEEISEKLVEHLAHNEFAFQRKENWKFRSKHRAEYLEIVLFNCPECRSMSTLVSKGNTLRCTHCNYAVRMAPDGFFRRSEGHLHFDTLFAWNRWQTEELWHRLDENRRYFSERPVFTEGDVLLEKGFKSLPLRALGTGSLELYSDRLCFVDEKTGKRREFPVPEIEGINVQNSEHLEFYFRESLFRIKNRDRRGNSYKYYTAVRHLRSRSEELDEDAAV